MREKQGNSILGKFRSIQSALMIFFSALVIVAVLIFLFIAIRFTDQTIYENSLNYMTQISNQVNYDIDSYIDYMENTSNIIVSGQDVPRYLFGAGYSNEAKEEIRNRILSQFTTIRESRTDIYNIAVVAENGNVLINDGREGLNPNIDITQQDWYRAAIEEPSGVAVSSSHVQNSILSSYKWVITLSRAIFNPQTKQREGIFFMDLNYSAISDLCNNNSVGNQGYIFVVDEEGNLIYHPKQQLIYGGLMDEHIDEIMNAEGNSLITGSGDESRLYTISKSSKTGWSVVGTAYISDLTENNKEAQLLYFLAAVVILIGVLLISGFLSRAITRPIRKLTESMSLVQKGDFEKANIDITDNNEIGSLSRSFNVMTEKIHALMEQNIYEQRQKRKSEIRALQSQINPHFLYNTLDSIIWMSEAGKNDEVVLMTSALAKLLRQSISNEKEQITIREEVEYVHSYLTIQKMRYKDKLEYTIDVDKQILSVQIIKFVLQPLVENAIYHGLKYKQEKGNLDIRGYKKGDSICLTVADDGAGMDEEELKHIFDKKEETGKANGVGVANVQKRIQLYYGPKYGISFFSKKSMGTVVTVTIPFDGIGGSDE